MRVKFQNTAVTVVELMGLSAMNADPEMLHLQLLELVRQFVEALAKHWGVATDTLQVTVEKERSYEHGLDRFHIIAVRRAEEEELETTPHGDGPLTLTGLKAKMAMLGFKL